MGTWGAASFENDDAADWAYELQTAGDDSVLRTALAAAAETAEWLELPTASIALAAAEVVAAAKAAPASNLPDDVRTWLATHSSTVGDDLVTLAQLESPALPNPRNYRISGTRQARQPGSPPSATLG